MQFDCYLGYCRTPVPPHGLDSLGVVFRLLLPRALVHVSHVSLLGLQYARQVHLLELELDRLRVLRRDGLRHILPYPERLLLRASAQQHKHRVRVSVDDSGGAAPPGAALFDGADGAFESLATLTHHTISHLHARHPAAEVCRRVPIGDVGDELESQLPGVQDAPQLAVRVSVQLHGPLYHEAGLQDLLQHLRQQPAPDVGLEEGHAAGGDVDMIHQLCQPLRGDLEDKDYCHVNSK